MRGRDPPSVVLQRERVLIPRIRKDLTLKIRLKTIVHRQPQLALFRPIHRECHRMMPLIRQVKLIIVHLPAAILKKTKVPRIGPVPPYLQKTGRVQKTVPGLRRALAIRIKPKMIDGIKREITACKAKQDEEKAKGFFHRR